MKRIFVVILSFALFVTTCLSTTSCSKQHLLDERQIATVKTNTKEETVSLSVIENAKPVEEVKLMLSSDGTSSYGLGYVGKPIVATVLPESASNKNIIWSIEWADANCSNSNCEISRIYQVVPNKEGSNYAEVRCYAEPQCGHNLAILTATTEEGGYTATCNIRFVGLPSRVDVAVESNNLTKDLDGNYITEAKIYDYRGIMNESDRIKFSISLGNDFGFVGVTPNFNVEIISFTGKINVANAQWDMNDYSSNGLTYDEYTMKTVDISSYNFQNEYKGIVSLIYDKDSYNNGKYLEVFVHFKNVNTLDTQPGDIAYLNELFHSIPEGENLILTLKVTDENSGLSKNINIIFETNANGVILDQTEIIF